MNFTKYKLIYSWHFQIHNQIQFLNFEFKFQSFKLKLKVFSDICEKNEFVCVFYLLLCSFKTLDHKLNGI